MAKTEEGTQVHKVPNLRQATATTGRELVACLSQEAQTPATAKTPRSGNQDTWHLNVTSSWRRIPGVRRKSRTSKPSRPSGSLSIPRPGGLDRSSLRWFGHTGTPQKGLEGVRSLPSRSLGPSRPFGKGEGRRVFSGDASFKHQPVAMGTQYFRAPWICTTCRDAPPEIVGCGKGGMVQARSAEHGGRGRGGYQPRLA